MARGKQAAADQAPVEGLWDLPDGWRWERLSDVSSEPERGAPSCRFADEFRYLDVSSINGNEIAPKKLAVADAPSRARQFVANGDTVLSGVRVYLRNMTMIQNQSVDVASTAFCVIRPNEEVDPSFLFHWVSSDQFINALIPLQRGNSPPAVLDNDVRERPIPIPPLEVQSQITARIDALFAEIAAGEAALAAARAGVETYRKALLKAAVTGDLTADWRREQAASGQPQESGQTLLTRILTDRRTRWHADPKNAKKKYAEPAGPDTDGLPDLPEGWAWASWDQVGTAQNGKSFPSSDYSSDGVKLLRPGNLNLSGWVTWTEKNSRFLPDRYGIENPDMIVGGGELVMNLTAQSLADEFLGRVCLTKSGEQALLNQRLARLVGFGVSNEYAQLVLKSPMFRIFVDRLNTGSLIQHMYTRQLAAFPLPVPSAREQEEIVRQLKGNFATADDFATCTDIALDATTLRQSILAAAFRGDLIP